MAAKDVVNMLKKSIINQPFKGRFIGRQFVPLLNEYRDVVEIEKSQVYHSLLILIKCLEDCYDCKSKWLSVTLNENVCKLWVKLPSDAIFGNYIFFVHDVFINRNEIVFKVIVVSSTAAAQHDGEEQSLWDRILYSSSDIFTRNNIKETVRFLFVFIVTVTYGVFHVLGVLLHAFLTIAQLLPRYIETLTPFLLACVDALTKCVGGLYLLIAMFFGAGRNPNNYQNRPMPNRAMPNRAIGSPSQYNHYTKRKY